MSPDPAARVLLLLQGDRPASRNRDFASFRGRQGQRVHRLYRLYLSLLKEVKAALGRPEARVRLRFRKDGLMVEIKDAKLAYHRTCLVPPALAGFFQDELDGLQSERDLP